MLKRRASLPVILLACLLSLSLWSCRAPTIERPTPVIPQPVETETVPPPTETPPPLPTEAPATPLALLIAPPGSDPTLAASLQTLLTSLAGEQGMTFELRSGLQAGDLVPELRAVVVLGPDPGVAALAAAAPGTQFLAVGIPGLKAGTNLSVLAADGERPDQQAFLAGVIAATITPNWRVAVISTADSVSGKAARYGFSNGVIYFCGLCRPVAPPFQQYPLYMEIHAGAAQGEWQAVVDSLLQRGVKTVYVSPAASSPELLDYLAQNAVTMIGSTAPPAAVQSHWAATVQSDLLQAVRDLWPKLLKGEGGASLVSPLVITDVNPALFSAGQAKMAGDMRADLLSGYLDTGVDPATGELR